MLKILLKVVLEIVEDDEEFIIGFVSNLDSFETDRDISRDTFKDENEMDFGFDILIYRDISLQRSIIILKLKLFQQKLLNEDITNNN